jgi:hypothetical protein
MAKIKLNNNEYPIPDSALASATADFVAHLGTIAGNGLKVVVNGVEYSIDASKVAGAVSALDTAFGELENGGDVPSYPTPSEGLVYTINDDGTSYSVGGIGECTDTEIVIADNYEGLPVTSIGDYAFQDCSSITSVVIPGSVTSMNYGAFYNCDSLVSVEIGDGVPSIDLYAFAGCGSLTSVVIPDSVTRIGECAFDGCNNLTSKTFKGTIAQWNAITVEEPGSFGSNIVQCSDGQTAFFQF